MLAPVTLANFTGSGLIFPIEIDSSGRPKISTGFDLIKSDLLILLNWAFGTKLFNETFGCRVIELLDEPNTTILGSLIITFIRSAISNWETRIELLDTTIISVSSDSIKVKLTYVIVNTQQEDSFIYPFYRSQLAS